MQAEDGLSLDAQRAAITAYCNTHDIWLIRIFEDVESGARSNRRGLQNALEAKADIFVVLKFDRLSRSIKHFCQLYEDYFSQSVELVAIREAIRLDSALGRALVSILLVFAQMEREAMGERTKEAISHIHRSGYFFGKVPFGKRALSRSGATMLEPKRDGHGKVVGHSRRESRRRCSSALTVNPVGGVARLLALAATCKMGSLLVVANRAR